MGRAKTCALACPGENTIAAFLEKRLLEKDQAHVDDHLAKCEVCRQLVAESAALGTHVSASPGTNASDVPDALLGQRLARAQAQRRIGKLLNGKWTIERLIGAGGMAFVFAATHRNGRRVAIKMMLPALAVEPALVERFLREGYVANRVDHPGAVVVLDDDVDETGEPFLVMELLEGETLGSRLAEKGPLSVPAALAALDQLLDVLAAAHDKGIVHRDIKPDNLFATTSGTIKVLDFGIARLRDRLKGQEATQTGITMGTIGFMSPEQARGQTDRVDARSDIWAAGGTLYMLLTGCTVHEAETTNQALLRAMTESVAPVRARVPWLQENVAAILDRAMAFEPDDRYQDARAMQRAIRELFADATQPTLKFAAFAQTTAQPERAPRSNRRLFAVLAALAAVAVAIILIRMRSAEVQPDAATSVPAGTIVSPSVSPTPAAALASAQPPASTKPEVSPAPSPTQAASAATLPPAPRASALRSARALPRASASSPLRRPPAVPTATAPAAPAPKPAAPPKHDWLGPRL